MWYSVIFYQDRNMMKLIPMRSYQYLLIWKKYYLLDITTYTKTKKRYLIQTRSQTKINGTILPKVHGIDKGVNPNVRPEKQIIKPVVTPVQSHVPTKSKDKYHVKPRLGQGKACIKKKMLRFPIPQPCDKPEQSKLLPGRRPIIQIAERPSLQPFQIVTQPEIISKILLKEKFIFKERLA